VSGEQATAHGVWDYWLRGNSFRPADRELARAIAARFPLVPVHMRAANDFTLRAARWAALRGVSRFVRAGPVTWLPGGRNVHDAARKVNPRCEVAYADGDEQAHDMIAGLTSGARRTGAVRADPCDPAGLLGSAPVSGWVAEGEPVCLIVWLSLSFAEPGEAAGIVEAYATALPAGSAIALTVALADDSPGAAELLEMFSPGRGYRCTAQDVTAWLAAAKLETVPPGVADVRLLGRPGWVADGLEPVPPGIIVGGTGLVR
jgi:hypothetical protein